MRYTDIAIIGGGLAGSTAAAMLGRAGIATVLIDPHETYPFDFRVEKLSGEEQIERFQKTGIADQVLRAATHDGENWIARFGYLLDKKPSRQFGITYDQFIQAIRAEILAPADLVCAKVTDVSTSAERQTAHAVQRRDDLGAAGGAGQRIECRAAPQSRHRTPDRQHLPFHLDRIRPRAGRPPGFRISGADLFFGAAERPYPLSDAVSGRQPDAGQSVHLSRGRRSLAARDAPQTGRDHECRAAEAAPDHRRIRRCRRRQDQAGRHLCLHRLSPARHRAGR